MAPPSSGERDKLLVSLRRLTPMPPDEHLNPIILRAYQEVVAKILRLEHDSRLIPPLLASLGPGEGRGAFRKVIAHVETFPAHVAAPPLLEALERGTDGPRRWAAFALGRLGWQPALPALREALRDGVPAVRRSADLSVRMLEATAAEQARSAAAGAAAAATAAGGESENENDPLFRGMTITDEDEAAARRAAEREAARAAAERDAAAENENENENENEEGPDPLFEGIAE